MIAASDPQEFVPSGRQQALEHPGPLEQTKNPTNTDLDDYLLTKLEKVSLADEKQNEWWILRKISLNTEQELNNEKENDNKHLSGTKSQYFSDLLNDSKSFSRFSNKRWSTTSDLNTTKTQTSTNSSNKFNVKSKSNYVEEELYVKGCTVVWSRGLLTNTDNLENGRRILCCYTTPLPIKQAIWCTFHCERPTYNQSNPDTIQTFRKSAICVIDKHHVRVFMTNGEDFVIPTPFEIKRVWNTAYGILIERNVDSLSKYLFCEHPSILYTLAYPLDDICPVAINQTSSAIQLLNNNNVSLVFTCEKPSICMLFDRQTKQHSVYFIRTVKSNEKLCQFNSSKKKLSIWENLINGNNLVTPSPVPSSKTPSLSSFLQPSRSQSTKSAFSRCQSSAFSTSSWLLQTSFRQHMKNIDVAPSFADRSFFNCSKAMSHVMASPKICFDHIWTDSYTFQENSIACAASKVFLCDDLTSQWYLCYILPSRYQLSMVQIDFSNTPNINFGILTSISAKDAIPIPALHMLAILEHNGNISLYSGMNLVGKLHIGGTLVQHTPSPLIRRNLPQFNMPFPRRSSLLPHCKQTDPKFDEHLLSPVLPNVPQAGTTLQLNFLHSDFDSQKSVLNELTDPIENRITLKYTDGTCYRITLPNLANSSLVANCLKTIRSCLHRDAALTFLSRWYANRNVLGTQDLTAEQEWNMFVQLFYDLLGYENDLSSNEFSKEVPVTPSSVRDKKRSKPSASGDDDDFQYLLNNAAQNKQQTMLEDLLNIKLPILNKNKTQPCLNSTINSNAILFPYIQLIHSALHLLYEDFKLYTHTQNDLLPLMELLNKLSNDLGLWKYSLHYWYDFPREAIVRNKSILCENDRKLLITYDWMHNEPINIFMHIYKLLKGEEINPYPFMDNVNVRSKDIIQLCGIISQHKYQMDSLLKNVSLIKQNDDELLNEKTNSQLVLMMVKMGITMDDLNTLPYGVRLLFYNKLWQLREQPPTNWPMEAYLLISREDLAIHLDKFKKQNECKEYLTKYGMYSKSQLQEYSLSGVTQDPDQIDGMEDCETTIMKLRFADDVRVQETKKMLNSSKPVPIVLVQRPDVSDHDFIEEQEKHLYAICTRTMALPVGRGMFTLRTVTPLVTEPLQSPTLCLLGKAPPHGSTVELTHIDTPNNMNLWPLFHNGVANGLRITPDADNINDTWITFNKPKSNNIDQHVEHSGFLMALGLNGHLKNLEYLSTYEYLVKLHELLTVGLLIGLSATHRGTTNVNVMKMLSIHIEALLPPTSMEMDVPQNLQVAALFGVGLLYQETAHRHIAEVLLSEIGRPPGPEMENSVDRESYSLAAGLALGLVTLKCGGNAAGLSDLNLPDNLLYYMIGGNKRLFSGTQKDKYKVASFQIREGSTVNLDVTSPGATLALGLMYLGSGNKAVADWMTPPATQYLLDFVRPDFLMLRILSKSLIMWNEIEPSKEWIEDQVPNTIRPYCMVQPTTNLDIDYEAMNQAYCNIITGASFALGLRYAGTANQDAFETLLHYCHMFTSLTGKSIAELAGKPTIETCLNVLLLSVAMVMAGSGNLEIMRLIRHLRRRVGVSSTSIVTYGSHLAIHMALGLLFLGGGRYTLSNHPKSVAALICAFYPKFPTHSNDNRYHLQAFRHLYVLAVEMRLIIPKDVYLDKCCYVNLRLVYLNGEEFKMRVPGLLPDLELLDKVMVDDERYWQVVFERGHNWDILLNIMSTTGYVEVKQRAGCLSHSEDKYGYRSELARTLTQSEIIPWDPSPSNIIMSFSSDKQIKLFCDHFLTFEAKGNDANEQRLCEMLTKLTYDAVTKDKQILIPIYTSLIKCLNDLDKSINVYNIWQLKLIQVQVLENNLTNLLSDEIVLALKQNVKSVLIKWANNIIRTDLYKYLNGKDFTSLNNDVVNKLAVYVTYFDLPFNCVQELDGQCYNMRNYLLDEFKNCVELFQAFLDIK